MTFHVSLLLENDEGLAVGIHRSGIWVTQYTSVVTMLLTRVNFSPSPSGLSIEAEGPKGDTPADGAQVRTENGGRDVVKVSVVGTIVVSVMYAVEAGCTEVMIAVDGASVLVIVKLRKLVRYIVLAGSMDTEVTVEAGCMLIDVEVKV